LPPVVPSNRPHSEGLSAFDVVIPTSGRPSLARTLESLLAGAGPAPRRVLVVDDRRERRAALPLGPAAARVDVVAGPARGPAAARNAGWRRSEAEWIAFLDDDVVLPPGWREALARDLAGLPPPTAGSQGRVRVPLPEGRRPTDWERNVAGLEGARWVTADMAYRRSALAAVGGFDERFERPYREDADLALRMLHAGFELVRGERTVLHPPGAPEPWVSLRLQAGNADDALMDALHGRGRRERAGASRGRLRSHVAVAAAGVGAAAAVAAGRRGADRALGLAWAAGTAELAWARIAPGPRTPAEVATMAWTSTLMPFAAVAQRLRGLVRRRRLLRDADRAPFPQPAAVLLDRDGTLVADIPYNGDPARVRPMPGAREALERLRRAGVPLAVVSNQSGIARGLVSEAQVAEVNRRIDDLLGPLGPWLVCPHHPDAGCACRKPRPGLVLRAAARLSVAPERCALIGDIGADVEAARAAGARGVLVPTARTRPEEVARAEVVAPDLGAAVDVLLGAAA
jgi:HAD superfamily hydrolase (TIGR01662 family)